MRHALNQALVHHPLGHLVWLLPVAAVLALVLVIARRKGEPPLWLRRANTLAWTATAVGFVMSLVGEMACSGLVHERIQCASEMDELAVGMLMYAEDWDDRFPPQDRWLDQVVPYGGARLPWRPCPAYEGPYPYAMNRLLCTAQQSKLGDPGTTILLVEHPCRGPNETVTTFHPDGFRHFETMNIAFADGHMRWRWKGASQGLRWEP